MRIVGYDLECSSLSGMVGRLLCGVVKDFIPPEYGRGKVQVFRGDDKKYRTSDFADDGPLAVAIRDCLEQADVVVGHNSKLFDRKFLNARLMKAGERPLKSQFNVDTMWIVRTHMRTSSKLVNVQQFLGLPDEKTDITWDDWTRGIAFDKKALDTIADHCIKDVEVLEEAYWKLLPMMRTISRA